MRAVIQRVKEASVQVEGKITGSIGLGLIVYLGIGKGDSEVELDYVINKISKLRVFEDDKGKMNCSVKDINGNILIISQFTLYGCIKKGTRPSFNDAEDPEVAEKLYNLAIEKIELALGKPSQSGVFGAHMEVSSINDGPVTLLLSKDKVQ